MQSVSMTTAVPRLRVHHPPGTERLLLMEKDTFNIGRRPDNDLVIAEKDISRRLAMLPAGLAARRHARD